MDASHWFYRESSQSLLTNSIESSFGILEENDNRIYNYAVFLHVFRFLVITSDVYSHLTLINTTWKE